MEEEEEEAKLLLLLIVVTLQEQLEVLWQQFKSLQRQLQEQSESEPKETLTMQIEANYDHLILEGDKLVEIRRDEQRWVTQGGQGGVGK